MAAKTLTKRNSLCSLSSSERDCPQSFLALLHSSSLHPQLLAKVSLQGPRVHLPALHSLVPPALCPFTPWWPYFVPELLHTQTCLRLTPVLCLSLPFMSCLLLEGLQHCLAGTSSTFAFGSNLSKLWHMAPGPGGMQGFWGWLLAADFRHIFFLFFPINLTDFILLS